MEKERIYFIAIIPPQEICDRITAFRLDFADRFKSRAALRVIPHITMKAPFKLTPAGQTGLLPWFHTLSFPSGPFQLELKDFGVFNKKRNPVVFVNPVLHAPLSSLQQEIIRSFRLAYPDIPVSEQEMKFHPHMTIAYRDLSFENFLIAWKEYQHREYRAVFTVDSIALLQHDGRVWNAMDAQSVR